MSLEAESLVFCAPLPDYFHLTCPICLELLYDRSSNLIVCCGSHICDPCSKKLPPGQNCPMCKSGKFQKVPDINHQRALSSLKVYCINQSKGCSWSGELKHLKNHITRKPNGIDHCQYQEFPCKHSCGLKAPLSLLISHENETCDKRPMICQFCKKYESTAQNLTSVHYLVCPERCVTCPSNGCGAKMKRSKLNKHLTNKCSFVEVKCEFADYRCQWSDKRNKLDGHLKSNWKEHITLVSSKGSKDMREELDELKIQVVDLYRYVAELTEQIAQLRDEKRALHEQLNDSKPSTALNNEHTEPAHKD